MTGRHCSRRRETVTSHLSWATRTYSSSEAISRYIIDFSRQNLSPMKVPRFVLFTDALPHTPSHRVAKHKIKALPDLMTRAVDTQAK